jgi:putative transposase
LILLLTEGQVSDYRGAATVLPDLPDADMLIADKGYDSDWFREALTDLEIEPCIPGRANRKAPIPFDAGLHKQRNRIERMFGRLKDWRRIATRYDRCAHTFISAICIAATVIFWL